MSMSVIRSNNNSLHLQWVSTRGKLKKREKERIKEERKERSPWLACKIAKGKIVLHRFSHEHKMPGNGFIARLPEISLSG